MNSTLSTAGRIRFHQGKAVMWPAPVVPTGMVEACVSVISPGTERRHLIDTGQGPARDAGYMNLARTDGGWALAPCPHGAAFCVSLPGTITTAHLPVHLLAAARFQLMASLGLDRTPELDLEHPVVVGSGPVAVGAILELRRRGADRIHVWTHRSNTLLAHLPGLVPTNDPGRSRLVVDTTGEPDRALAVALPGAVVGLLGTPERRRMVDALAVHRGGVLLVGMHELARVAPGAPAYQDVFDRCTSWLSSWGDRDVLQDWYQILPGERAPQFYANLLHGNRPAEPFILWDWGLS